ncbi:MAG: haloacid dehalogenase [Thermoprotei archaeon]|nr:MAG: haloacid dehalogenase [Thermoprotei archaeon]
MKIGVVFDVDGVLLDSYRGIEEFYEVYLPRIAGVNHALSSYLVYMEYLGEAIGLLRDQWWFDAVPGLTEELYDALITKYWEVRISNTTLEPGVPEVLERMRGKGYLLFSVSYRDEIYGLKRYRLEAAGLKNLFDEVVVVGEDGVSNRCEGIKYLQAKHSLDRVVYVDDKPLNLYRISIAAGDSIVLVHYRFKHLVEFPWKNPGRLFKEVHSLYELESLLDRMFSREEAELNT